MVISFNLHKTILRLNHDKKLVKLSHSAKKSILRASILIRVFVLISISVKVEAPFLGHLSQSEKLSDIKPPLMIPKKHSKNNVSPISASCDTKINHTNFFILRSVLHVFKRPLEEPDQKGGQLLNQTELKIIFGNLPPIYDVHKKMLAVSALLRLLVIIYVQ